MDDVNKRNTQTFKESIKIQQELINNQQLRIEGKK